MPRHLMRNLVTVSRPTVSQDSSLGQVASYTNIYTNVPANIQPASGSAAFLYAQRNIKVTNTIWVDTLLTIKVGDRITSGTTTYIVVGFRNLIEMNRVWGFDCEVYLP